MSARGFDRDFDRDFNLGSVGAGLVVARSHHELEEALRSGSLVVTAPPGTGNTTCRV